MATLTSITSAGTLAVNGILDEYTSISPSNIRITSNTIFTSTFDEITYNATSTTTNGGRYNLTSYSNYFAFDGSLGWNNIFTAGATITSGIDAPDGSLTAVRFSCNNTTNALLRTYHTSFTPNGSSTYTISFWARHVSGTKTGCTSDLADGVGATYSSTLITGSWVRVSYSGIPTATSKGFLDLFSDSNTNNVIDFWGVQIEVASTASIYQPIYNNIITPTFAKREASDGKLYVTNQFDELNGTVYTGNLLLNIDPSLIPYTSAGITDINSTTTFTLHSPSYYSATTNGIQFTRTAAAPKDGGGAYITGTGSLAVSTFLYNDHTWEVWFKINDRTPGGYDVTEGYSLLAAYQGYHAGYMYTATNMFYYVWDGVSALRQCVSWSLGASGSQINEGSWYQIAVVRSSGNVFTPYINGAPLGTGSTQASLSSTGIGTNNTLAIGKAQFVAAGASSYVYYSKCTHGNMKMYNRALSADEIKSNYEALRSRFGI